MLDPFQGKPVERRGRKAYRPNAVIARAAGLPGVNSMGNPGIFLLIIINYTKLISCQIDRLSKII